MFDVCNKKSLEHVPMWIMEAKRHIEPHKAVFILVGTKVSGEGRESKFGEAQSDRHQGDRCLSPCSLGRVMNVKCKGRRGSVGRVYRGT